MEERVAHLEQSVALLTTERDHSIKERDEYKRLYLSMLELCKKLEQGILGQKRERFTNGDFATMSLLALLTEDLADTAPSVPPVREEVEAHTRAKPTGRKPLPEHL